MARFKTINDIVNQIVVETGTGKAVPDVFGTSDAAFIQLTTLANSCGYELIEVSKWEVMLREHSFITSSADSGTYDLPDDFAYMINQTGWDRTNNVPLLGPLSSQEWQYLEGRDLVSHTIYASFREHQGKFDIFPQPPPNGLNIHFEYMSRNWVQPGAAPGTYTDKVAQAGDIVMFEPTLFERLLKVRFLEARGFDTTAAAARFDKSLQAWAATDKGAPVLNAGRNQRGFPYLGTYSNLPDTGYG